MAEAERAGGPGGRAEAARLKVQLEDEARRVTANLTPWQQCQVARHPDRPYCLDYVRGLFTDWVEIHGDRSYADDPAIVAGLARFEGDSVAVVGHQKGRDTRERLYRNFGQPRPEGYRKALRVMRMAEKFGRPIISLVDTQGASPGIDAEERGQAEAIAHNLREMASLTVPIVVVVTGEGGSGGALAIGIGDRILMMEHAIYSVISPEAATSILYKKKEGDEPRPQLVKEVAASLKITAQDLYGLKVIDAIVPEPLGGAHRAPGAAIATVGASAAEALDAMADMGATALRTQRRDRFLAIGRFETETAAPGA